MVPHVDWLPCSSPCGSLRHLIDAVIITLAFHFTAPFLTPNLQVCQYYLLVHLQIVVAQGIRLAHIESSSQSNASERSERREELAGRQSARIRSEELNVFDGEGQISFHAHWDCFAHTTQIFPFSYL
jgi:hypothetical protein